MDGAGYGAQGAEGSLILTNVDGFISGSVAISSLPTCGSTMVGTLAWVNNGVAAPTYHLSVSTTGSATWPVFCTYNGTTYGWVY